MLKNDRWQNFNRIVIEGLNECVGSRFSGWAQRRTGIQAQQTQYNEFVENRSKSWALMGQRLVWKLEMIKQDLRTEPGGPTPRGKGLLIREYEFLPSLTPGCGRSPILYIPSFGLSSFYTCQSSMSILECTSHRPLFLTLCELLWLRQHCLEVTST